MLHGGAHAEAISPRTDVIDGLEYGAGRFGEKTMVGHRWHSRGFYTYSTIKSSHCECEEKSEEKEEQEEEQEEEEEEEEENQCVWTRE
jgi:hypothetical protein